MVKIQIDLTEEEDRLVEMFKAENRMETKESAVKEMVKRSGKCKHKYELTDKHNTTFGRVILQRCIYCGEIKKDFIKSSITQ